MNVWRKVEEHKDNRAELAPTILYNLHRPKGAQPIKVGHFFGHAKPGEPDAIAAAIAELDAAEAKERAAGINPISTDPEFLKAMAVAKVAGWKMILPDEARPNAAR